MANRLMKLNILFFSLLSLILFSVSVKATEVQEQHTAASSLEVKIPGSDLLDEDVDCIWVEEHKDQIMAECKEYMADFALINLG